MNQSENIKRIANHYGKDNQSIKTIEELSELIQAIAKGFTFEYTQHITEEIADVEIMLEQMKYLMGIKEDVDIVKKNKIERTLKRMGSSLNT